MGLGNPYFFKEADNYVEKRKFKKLIILYFGW